MNLETLKEIKPMRFNNGRPSPTLTDKEWQQQFEVTKLYITPHDKSVTRMSGRYSRESGKGYENGEYYGATNWQNYCSVINDMLKNIRTGGHDFCYFGYQIIDLLKFHKNSLHTKYCDGYWEVWLER